jgi:hypothetical protein
VVVFVMVIVVVGAMVGVVSLVSGSKTTSTGLTSATALSSVETSSQANTAGNAGSSSSSVAESSTANTTSSILQSSTSCPPIRWTNSSGAASVSYQPAVEQIARDPAFVALTHGLCYSFALTDYGKVLNTVQWENLTNFVFDRYNGTITYPCGTFPAKLIVSQIQVSTVLNGTTIEKVASMGLNNDTASLNEYMACPWGLTPPPVWVKSMMLVPPYVPAGPTIELTLANAGGQAPIVGLTAVLSLTGKNQAFVFSDVSSSTPLLPGQSSSQSETILGPASVDTSSVYPVIIVGAFQNGTKFSESVQVEVQNGPPAESTPLELRVNLNATMIKSGDAITATISLFNPLGVNVSVSPDYQSSSAIFSWNAHDFLCGGLAASNPTWSLAGYALFQGHYTAANLSSAGSPLDLDPPLMILCHGEANPGTVTFLPDSSTAVGYFPPQPNIIGIPPVAKQEAVMNATTETYVYKSGYYGGGPDSLFGYWAGPPGGVFGGQNATISSPYFHYFPPGAYTLVVEDMWGQVSYSYFQVTLG